MNLTQSKWMRALAWFTVYVIVCGSFYAIFGVLSLVYSVFQTRLMENILLWFSIGVPVVLMLIGFVSLLPFAEYAYTRQGALNPAIAREAYQATQRRRPEKKGLGILLGLAGLTIVVGINPWSILSLLLLLLTGPTPAITIEIVLLILLFTLYRRQLKQYIDQEDKRETD